MAAGESSTRSLQDTPTWAVATVCFVFIAISILLEHFINLLHKWLKRHRKIALIDAVEKLKSELMLLGFISLLLTVTQRPITKICIPTKASNTMLPCSRFQSAKEKIEEDEHLERRLASLDSDTSNYCTSKGMVSLMGEEGIHQLHIFIFVLALVQIVYTGLTMALGRAKMRRWKAWEKETQTTEYQVANDPRRFRYTRETSFGKRHMNSFTETTILLWIKCFFRQFFHSVAKVDYFTLRHGFISAHLSSKNAFNFQKYIQRSLEDDFKVVVGISPVMWFIVVIFMLLDVHGWHVFLWVSYIPLIILLVLGTKLEVIVIRMALQLKNENIVITGAPLVQPNDNLFWFGHPRYVLTLLHFTLFMNAFELAFFIWTWTQFGISSCYHESLIIVLTRIVLAVTVQVLCSYITLPLYALVTQMGSQFKSAVLEEHMAKALKQWHADVREQRKKQTGSSQPRYTPSIKVESTSNSTHLGISSPTPLLSEITPYSSMERTNEEEKDIVPASEVVIELPVLR